MPGRRGRLGWALLPGLLAGCVSQASSPEAEAQQPHPPEAPAPPPCKEGAPTDPAASFPGDRCGWFLEDREGALRLHSLDLDPPPSAVGSVPEPCAERPCVFEGVQTAIGPLVLVTVPSAHSEMPDGVMLGVSEGGLLSFVDLWAGAGPSVSSELTELGPAHALAPYDCGGSLGLFVEPRVDGGDLVEPPSALLAREGIYRWGPQGLEHEPTARDGCKPLRAIPVP